MSTELPAPILPSAGEPGEISKKEILRLTGISYGQFYRWKRLGLIPEAWFRRRATFTGQESFLPRDKVLERIRRIQEFKDRLSLEELAEMLSPDAARRRYTRDELSRMRWIGELSLDFLPADRAEAGYSFTDVLCLALVERLLVEGRLDEPQIRLLADTLLAQYGLLPAAGERRVTVTRREGCTSVVLHSGVCLFDRQTEIIESIDLNQLAEQVKLNLGKMLGEELAF